jgi:hypothetical protein
MYCENETFASAIDFSGVPPGWHNFGVILNGKKEEMDNLVKKINCGAYLSKD